MKMDSIVLFNQFAFRAYLNLSPRTLPHPLHFAAIACDREAPRTTAQASRYRGSIGSSAFDSAAFEADRLSRDADARAAMEEEAASRATDSDDPKAWKWIIRNRIWDLMETRNFAQNPRPVHHRIPNFVGVSSAAHKLCQLEQYRVAKCVKVNPDSPQKQVRFLTLSDRKKLLTPQPRLRTGFFSILESAMLEPGSINEACTSVGVAKYGRPIGLDEKIKVDLIVIGSVAVDPRTGARLGKGEVGEDQNRILTNIYKDAAFMLQTHDQRVNKGVILPMCHDLPSYSHDMKLLRHGRLEVMTMTVHEYSKLNIF